MASEVVERAIRAADSASDVYLASLPTRLDQRPTGWRRKLSEARMSAALLVALDTEDEALVEAMADDIALPVWEVCPETFRKLGHHQREHCYEIARAALKALRKAIGQGVSEP